MFKADFHLVQNVARATAALLKLNRLLLGSIRELLRQKEKVARATVCTKWKSTFMVVNSSAVCKRPAYRAKLSSHPIVQEDEKWREDESKTRYPGMVLDSVHVAGGTAIETSRRVFMQLEGAPGVNLAQRSSFPTPTNRVCAYLFSRSLWVR